MEYKLNTTNYRDFKVIEDNKLAGRAYFIPYSKKEKLCAVDLKHERTDSDLVEVLSGEWDFKYYNDISLIPEVFDAAGVEFDRIHVPSTWQRTGYEPPVYLNCPYEFDLPNPNVPEHMSAGIYRKTFEVTNSDDVHILSFLGVVPCVDLYVNGMYVGYSEGAHNSAEFDISEFIYEGTNELLAVVHQMVLRHLSRMSGHVPRERNIPRCASLQTSGSLHKRLLYPPAQGRRKMDDGC